ncbi:YesL family protein [Bacillus alkalicellulosilyticus]|uniref:YesL family protein n=1 Tax=Alkalihalobacterium alkalicellulosilyticum TaxID=1912214 RepID=UPI0014835CBA|nr:DUF624 domain-containing protein [Bacillus alkalicellulosilyticus]
MEFRGVMGGLFRISEWITRLAYINILWIFFSIVGFLVIGFFPSTVAMFTVMRKLVMREVDIPIFMTFWLTFKKELVKSNILGYIVSTLGIVLYINITFLQHSDTNISFLLIPNMMIALLFLLTILYVFPVYVHYEYSIMAVLKNSLLLMIIHPIATMSMIIGSFTILIALNVLPAFSFFFSGSGFALLFTAISLWVFDRILQKKQVETIKLSDAQN